jgi:hypothetical protein
VSLGFGLGFCCMSSVSVVWRRRDLAFFFFFFFCEFLFFPVSPASAAGLRDHVSPGSVLYLDICFFLSGSLFFIGVEVLCGEIQNRWSVVAKLITCRSGCYRPPYSRAGADCRTDWTACYGPVQSSPLFLVDCHDPVQGFHRTGRPGPNLNGLDRSAVQNYMI